MVSGLPHTKATFARSPQHDNRLFWNSQAANRQQDQHNRGRRLIFRPQFEGSFDTITQSFGGTGVGTRVRRHLRRILTVPGTGFGQRLQVVVTVANSGYERGMIASNAANVSAGHTIIFTGRLFSFGHLFGRYRHAQVRRPPIFVGGRSFPRTVGRLRTGLPFRINRNYTRY